MPMMFEPVALPIVANGFAFVGAVSDRDQPFARTTIAVRDRSYKSRGRVYMLQLRNVLCP